MGTREELTATLVLLIDAAKPELDDLAAAIVAALPDKAWLFSTYIDKHVGFVALAGLDTDGIVEHAEEMHDLKYTGSREQLYVTLSDVVKHVALEYSSAEYYEQAFKELRDMGLFTSSNATTEEEQSDAI